MTREPFAAKLTTIWIGALFFWIISLFKGKYLDYLDVKYQTRNLVIGYLLSLFIICVIISKFI